MLRQGCIRYQLLKAIFPRIFFADQGDKNKILSVEQWGSIPWESTDRAFRGCSNLEVNATDTPDLSNVVSMNAMFRGCSVVGQNEAANWNWDVSNVEQMASMFRNAEEFNQDIGSWNVSNVQNFANMFEGAHRFNQDISGWITSSATVMNQMFRVADDFDQDIGGWDVSNVTNMNIMFAGADHFNQDLSDWDVSNVQTMRLMFLECYGLRPRPGFLGYLQFDRCNTHVCGYSTFSYKL